MKNFYLTCVSNSLHLVHVILVDDGVERRVQLVEEVHHVHGIATARQRREGHYVAEVNAAWFVVLGVHGFPDSQIVRNLSR